MFTLLLTFTSAGKSAERAAVQLTENKVDVDLNPNISYTSNKRSSV